MPPTGQTIAAMSAGNMTFADDKIALGKPADIAADAINFAQISINNDSSQKSEMGGVILTELKTLVADGSPSSLKKASDLIDETLKQQSLGLPQSNIDDLGDIKKAIDQRTAKEKGSGSVPDSPVPFRATISNGASAQMPK